MNRLVVDASVAVKWYIPEIHGDEAERILGSGYEMCAPDLLYSEVANVLWKHARRDAITVERAKAIMAALSRVSIRLYRAPPLVPQALDIALGLDRTVYDSLYLALAGSLGCKMVTADRRLYNSVRNSEQAPVIAWVEDDPTSFY